MDTRPFVERFQNTHRILICPDARADLRLILKGMKENPVPELDGEYQRLVEEAVTSDLEFHHLSRA